MHIRRRAPPCREKRERHAQRASAAGGGDVSGMMGVEPSQRARGQHAPRSDDTHAHVLKSERRAKLDVLVPLISRLLFHKVTRVRTVSSFCCLLRKKMRRFTAIDRL